MSLAQFPTNTREQIEFIIGQTAKPVTFYVVESLDPCPLCDLDPITNTATDSFCVACSGEYWIPTYSGVTLSGHVTWGKLDNRAWETGGMIDNGDCTVKIMYSDLADYVVHSSAFIEVEGRTMQPLPGGIILRGVPEINRIILALKEKER